MGAIAQDRQRCQFPFVVDEKPAFVPGGLRNSEGTRAFRGDVIDYSDKDRVRIFATPEVEIPTCRATSANARPKPSTNPFTICALTSGNFPRRLPFRSSVSHTPFFLQPSATTRSACRLIFLSAALPNRAII